MKHFFYIFLLICPLWACSSCKHDEDKLPGSKPEILLGKWECMRTIGPAFLPVQILETYEFTKSGGTIRQLEYFPKEDRYEDYFTRSFTDWSYDGEEIHFFRKKGSFSEHWTLSIQELTVNTVRFGGIFYCKKIDN